MSRVFRAERVGGGDAVAIKVAVEPWLVQVLRDGYTIHDRLLRAAMVGVAKPPAAG